MSCFFFDRDIASLSRSYKWLCRGGICYVLVIDLAARWRCLCSLLSVVVISQHFNNRWDCLYLVLRSAKNWDWNWIFFKNYEFLSFWIAVLDLKSIFSLVFPFQDGLCEVDDIRKWEKPRESDFTYWCYLFWLGNFDLYRPWIFALFWNSPDLHFVEDSFGHQPSALHGLCIYANVLHFHALAD